MALCQAVSVPEESPAISQTQFCYCPIKKRMRAMWRHLKSEIWAVVGGIRISWTLLLQAVEQAVLIVPRSWTTEYMLFLMLLGRGALNSFKTTFVCPWDACPSHRSLLHDRANGTLTLPCADSISSGLACLFSLAPITVQYTGMWLVTRPLSVEWKWMKRIKMKPKRKKEKKKNSDMKVSV